MIRVAQHERGVDAFEMLRRESFDRRLSADRREDRREEVAVRRGESPSAGAVVFRSDLELEHWGRLYRMDNHSRESTPCVSHADCRNEPIRLQSQSQENSL